MIDTEIIEIDLSKLNKKFNRIMSSMTMHHIKDIKEMLVYIYSMINGNGFIAIADLDSEDGSFHTEDTGVFHLGFDRVEFLNVAKKVGFNKLKISNISFNWIQIAVVFQ